LLYYLSPVPKKYNAFAYVIGGQGLFGSDNQKQLAHRGQIITFDKDGEEVEIRGASDTRSALYVLLIVGEPLNEPKYAMVHLL
jgi:redox-sensitive bicupin YhaK (pirin superfamily)